MKKGKEKGKRRALWLDITVAVVTLLVIILVSVGVGNIRDQVNRELYIPEERNLRWHLVNGEYFRLLEGVRQWEAAGHAPEGEEAAACVAVARYYDATVLMHACEGAGNAEKAKAWEKRRQSAADAVRAIPGYEEHLERVDALFEDGD